MGEEIREVVTREARAEEDTVAAEEVVDIHQHLAKCLQVIGFAELVEHLSKNYLSIQIHQGSEL